MNAYWQWVVCSAGALLAFAAGAMLAAFSFAIASFRFSSVTKPNLKADELSAAARYCIEHSGKVAAVISLSRRFLFACVAIASYFWCDAALELLEVRMALMYEVLIALVAILAALFFQYAVFDLPMARKGRDDPTFALSKFLYPFCGAYAVFAPMEYLARRLSQKIFGKKIFKNPPSFDYIDVEVMLRSEESETISPYAGKIVKNAIMLQDLDVSDVMLPRNNVVYFNTDDSNEENLALAEKTRHSRYPICKGNLDNCYGIVHIKDIFLNKSEKLDLMQLRRDTLRLKETEKLEAALAKLLKYKLHMALVEDEFCGVIGVMTLDIALSELVGQISDEFDGASDQTIRVIGKDKYKISGIASLHKVEEFLDVDFDTDEVSTFGGLITFSLGRFPEKGERVHFKKQNMRVTIDEVAERMIVECTVQMEEPEEPSI